MADAFDVGLPCMSQASSCHIKERFLLEASALRVPIFDIVVLGGGSQYLHSEASIQVPHSSHSFKAYTMISPLAYASLVLFLIATVTPSKYSHSLRIQVLKLWHSGSMSRVRWNASRPKLHR